MAAKGEDFFNCSVVKTINTNIDMNYHYFITWQRKEICITEVTRNHKRIYILYIYILIVMTKFVVPLRKTSGDPHNPLNEQHAVSSSHFVHHTSPTAPELELAGSHYNDIIMSTMVSQILGLAIVYLTVHSCGDQKRKHKSSASLTFRRGIHPWPVNSQHKGTVTRRVFPFDYVIKVFSKSFLIVPKKSLPAQRTCGSIYSCIFLSSCSPVHLFVRPSVHFCCFRNCIKWILAMNKKGYISISIGNPTDSLTAMVTLK